MNVKLENLEKKLNIANDLIDELNIEEFEIMPLELMVLENSKENTSNSDEKFEVFTLDTLKSDFICIRQNVMKLITSGQRILDSTSLIDVSDLKASQLMAIATLLKTIGENSKTLIDIYKQIVEIEKLRVKEKVPEPTQTAMINSGTVVNNQILFNGDTSQLLEFIKDNKHE